MMREIEWNLDLLNALSRIWKERHQTTKNLEDFYIHYALDQLADHLPGELARERATRAAERAQIHKELDAVKKRNEMSGKDDVEYPIMVNAVWAPIYIEKDFTVEVRFQDYQEGEDDEKTQAIRKVMNAFSKKIRKILERD